MGDGKLKERARALLRNLDSDDKEALAKLIFVATRSIIDGNISDAEEAEIRAACENFRKARGNP
jgi:DNA-binding MurR/RpiR family transcriptional regulator